VVRVLQAGRKVLCGVRTVVTSLTTLHHNTNHL